MKEFLQFFKVPLPDSARVTGVSITFHGLSPGWAFLLGLVFVSATVAVYLRTTPALSPARKRTLAALRSLLLVMILLMLMRPVLLLTVEGTFRRMLLLLIDASASMQIKDLRQEAPDAVRAAIATGLADPKLGLQQPAAGAADSVAPLARSEVLKAMLGNERLQLLSKLGETYHVVPYTFGQSVAAVSGGDAPPPPPGVAAKSGGFLSSLAFDQPYTAIGDAVRSVLDLRRGQPVAGIFLITDGGNNYGTSPADAAALAREDQVPLYIYGVGITSPHDIIVSQVTAPDVAFVKEEVPVSVAVRSRAMSGRTATLVLKLGDEVMDSKEVTFGADGEQTIPMKLLPTRKGDFELTASIEPLPDEAVKDNNHASRRVRVIDGKISLLYVEQRPRWEFRYLQAVLLRDPKFDAKFFLADGDPELGRSEGSPYLAELPHNKEGWLKYDVVVIGDVDPRLLDGNQQQNISDLVSQTGGGVVFLAGRNFMPGAYRGTRLQNLLPVELAEPSAPREQKGSVALRLTPAGNESPLTKLVDQADENAAVWKNLPGVYWDARVTEAKPAAVVLLDDPSPEKSTRGVALPVLATQNYGTGQALFMGTDETWRWRRNVGDRFYTRFWGQIFLRLGLPRVLGASRLTQLVTGRKSYLSGERVVISGRLYRPGFLPVVDPVVTGSLSVKPDEPTSGADLARAVSLQAIPGKPGFYEGEAVVETPGIYSFATPNDPTATLDFRVGKPNLEFSDVALNLPLLQKMADVSGGALYREEDLYKMLEPQGAPKAVDGTRPGANKIPAGLGGPSQRLPSPAEVELAFSPLYYTLMILVASAEWILRKRWQLK